MRINGFATAQPLCCAALALLVLCCTACTHIRKNAANGEVPDADIEKGKVLAQLYCGSCHMLPDPALLDAHSWEKGVLPAMGPRLGIFSYGNQAYPSSVNDPRVGRSFYPASPVVTPAEWGYILAYYTATSPDTLPPQQRRYPIGSGADHVPFEAVVPARRYPSPTTVLVHMDTASGTFYTSDVLKGSVYRWNRRLEITDSVKLRGAMTDMVIRKDSILACDIGVFTPTNGAFGSIDRLWTDAAGRLQKDELRPPAADKLIRPVQLAVADLNGDGREDIVVCEFGYVKGELAWLENKGSGRYEKHVLRAIPGAIRVYVRDDKHNGLPDIWVQFAQGEEGIFVFTNKGHGVFDGGTEVLRFPPCYGSTYFELDDFNRDGYPDILYTCGDNGDFSQVLKPYHGAYIFLNDGKNHFTQKWFYPINGCYKAVARDFDGDGDLDIAAISFFADYKHQPEEGFVYLENKGNLDFHPYTLPEGQWGRWITMDVGDFDGDGKPDILLGNCSIGPVMMKATTDWKTGPPFMLLRNIHH